MTATCAPSTPANASQLDTSAVSASPRASVSPPAELTAKDSAVVAMREDETVDGDVIAGVGGCCDGARTVDTAATLAALKGVHATLTPTSAKSDIPASATEPDRRGCRARSAGQRAPGFRAARSSIQPNAVTNVMVPTAVSASNAALNTPYGRANGTRHNSW